MRVKRFFIKTPTPKIVDSEKAIRESVLLAGGTHTVG